MPHFCRICKTHKPNERFSGHGHRTHVCKKCKKMDKDKRDAIVQEDELFGFLNQKNISAKNIKRLEVLKLSTNSRIAELADIVYEIAKIKPRKRRRLKFLGKTRKDLLGKLIETGLIHAHHRW